MSATRPIDAVLFDKDGTLLDVDRTWGPALWAVMTELADGDRGRLEALMAVARYREADRRFDAASPVLAGAPDDYADDFARAIGTEATPAFRRRLADLIGREGLRHLTPIGDPAAIMASLARAGLPLGIATNHGEAAARAQASALGLAGYLDFYAGFDSGHGAKPAPGMILAFAKAVGIAVTRVAMVGDSFHDLEAARHAGAIAVAVPSGLISRAALAAAADLVIDDLSALIPLTAARVRV